MVGNLPASGPLPPHLVVKQEQGMSPRLQQPLRQTSCLPTGQDIFLWAVFKCGTCSD